MLELAAEPAAQALPGLYKRLRGIDGRPGNDIGPPRHRVCTFTRAAWYVAPSETAGRQACTDVRGDSRVPAARKRLRVAGPSLRAGVASDVMRASYRLQLTREFPLAAAAGMSRYLARLGVSHLYSSPILAARAGSTHGYDVVDPTRLNPELGTEQDLAHLRNALDARGLRILLDVVPNHQAATSENPAWDDVLTRGARRASHPGSTSTGTGHSLLRVW